MKTKPNTIYSLLLERANKILNRYEARDNAYWIFFIAFIMLLISYPSYMTFLRLHFINSYIEISLITFVLIWVYSLCILYFIKGYNETDELILNEINSFVRNSITNKFNKYAEQMIKLVDLYNINRQIKTNLKKDVKKLFKEILIEEDLLSSDLMNDKEEKEVENDK